MRLVWNVFRPPIGGVLQTFVYGSVCSSSLSFASFRVFSGYAYSSFIWMNGKDLSRNLSIILTIIDFFCSSLRSTLAESIFRYDLLSITLIFYFSRQRIVAETKLFVLENFPGNLLCLWLKENWRKSRTFYLTTGSASRVVDLQIHTKYWKPT